MRARPVLLDGSFIAAVLDDDHPSHAAARSLYASLIDNYRTGTDRLFALSTVLAGYPRDVRRGALAPIETTWVARQHRTAVKAVPAPTPDVALTLLMLRRERFRAIATALHDFDRFDIDVLSVAADNVALLDDSVGRGPDVERIPPVARISGNSIDLETESPANGPKRHG